VVVRYDAVLQTPDGRVQSRRFESRVSGVAAESAAVGPALNDAANRVAGEVADWVG
jgi:cholesterol transport system auxiliary component